MRCLLLYIQVDKWVEKQEAAKERKEAKRQERQAQLAQKQPAPSAEALARWGPSLTMHSL